MFDDTADAIYRPRARGAGRSPLKTLVEPRRHPIYRQLLQAAPHADRAALKEMLALAAVLDAALERQASELGAERHRGGGGDRRGRRHRGEAAPCMTSTLHRLFSELASAGEELFGPSASYELAPLAGGVLERFARRAAHLSASPSLAFHGTPSANIPSILERGLLVPGNGNDVRVANGSAYGVGIYTAQQPGASLGYCKGSSQMLALGVLDLASGGQEVLRRVGNVTVFFDEAHVVPIGVVSFKQHEVAKNRSHAARGMAPMNAAARARYQKAAVQTTAPASARRLPHTADAVKLAHRRAAGRKDKRATRQRHAARQLKHMVREGETTVAVDPLAPPARTAAQRAASQRRQREATRQQRNTRCKGERKQQARAKRARTVMQRG
jgi:hypothetical protein